eukprot:PITA_19687
MTYNAQFVKKFAGENPNLAETTKDWSRKEEPLKKDKNGMYITGSLTSPYCFAATMICRLFGMPYINKFSSEWLPLIDAATNAEIVDWAKIFSNNLYTAVMNYWSKRSLSQRVYPPFYLSAYIMDSICYVSKFPTMGWKWTTQDSLPIHVYHKVLWDSQFAPHFYQICHELILPLYRMMYDEEPPRCSLEAQIDIIPIARLFGEEWFTYIRVFESTVPPHVLPLYIPDKLLAWEIAYQTRSEGGLTKELKDKNKAIWPQFPVACGAFSLFDVGHAFAEVENVTSLQLFKLPARPFDPNNVAHDFTTNVKVKVFVGKKDLFDDLFQSRSSLQEILREAQSKLSPYDLQRFMLYRERRLASVPIEKLRLPARESTPSVSLSGNSSTSRSKSNTAQGVPEHSKKSGSDQEKSEVKTKDTTRSSAMSRQQVIASPPRDVPPPVIKAPLVTTELDKEWEKFNELISLEGQAPRTPVNNTQVTQEMVSTIVSSVTETENIHIAPPSELLLNVEEIPPLDVFYSPQHKLVVRRQRKKRKIENTLSQDAEHLDVLWKDPNNNPTENLTKLSQIAGAYASVTIDKASKVQQLLKEQENQIQLLQRQLQQANASIEASKQLEKLQEEFQQMQISYQISLDEKGKRLQTVQEIHKDEPKLAEFISESVGLNEQLLQQQEELGRKISQWGHYCELSDKITNQVADLRNDYDQIDRRVTKYLAWQDGEEGKRANAPRIKENHKELLFNKWDDQIRANLIEETTPGYLPNKLRLEAEWKQKAQENGKAIQALNMLNWECYWAYLVKPHSQWMTMKCIINSAEKVVPTLIDSVFAAHLSAEVGQPNLLKSMMNTCSFKDQVQK